MAEKKFVPTGETETTEAAMTRSFNQAVEISRLGLRRTGWLWLAYLTSAVAAIGFAMEMALEKRGVRPEPSIEFKW